MQRATELEAFGIRVHAGRAPQPHIRVDFASECSSLSWALCGGGYRRTHSVVWCQVENRELGPDVDAGQFLQLRLAELQRPEAVGLLTSADLRRAAIGIATVDGIHAVSIATVGFGNALCIGDPPGHAHPGTINVLCWCSVPLTYTAHLEALSLATEARTWSVLQAQVPSTRSSALATGTGTDCLAVLAAAPSHEQKAHAYAGKHTALGSAVGQCVAQAVRVASG